jgi:hypothetical protein
MRITGAEEFGGTNTKRCNSSREEGRGNEKENKEGMTKKNKGKRYTKSRRKTEKN